MQEYIFYGTGKIPNEPYLYAKKYIEDTLNGKLLFASDRNESLWNYETVFPPAEIKKYPKAVIILFCDPLKLVVSDFRKNGIENKIKVSPRFSFYFIADPNHNWDIPVINSWFLDYETRINMLYDSSDIFTKLMLKQIATERKMTSYSFIDYDNYITKEFDFSHKGVYFTDKKLLGENNFTFVDGGGVHR